MYSIDQNYMTTLVLSFHSNCLVAIRCIFVSALMKYVESAIPYQNIMRNFYYIEQFSQKNIFEKKLLNFF